jgi:NRAMP (natural resistance-associated macrophage protein)-like metal ion transporter
MNSQPESFVVHVSDDAIKKEPGKPRVLRLRNFFHELGPGLITGAADDDPSGISTYSVGGASFGYGLLWTALLSFPLMTSVQLMCARVGMVTGMGLAGVVRRQYSRSVLWVACALLIIANTFNIGADLGGMAEVAQMISGVTAFIWLPVIAILIVVMLIRLSYRRIARIFKWLTLVLFAYVVTAFLSHPHWPEVLRATFVPHIELSVQYLATVLGIFGTTISPYLFFWQAAQEVEEERSIGRLTVHSRLGATHQELRKTRTDVCTGMAFSNLVMYFIILATGATLYRSGHRDIETARQAAEALRPLAGNGAYFLFALGLLGTGMLGVPVLAGSAAYAVAEAMHWRGSLSDRPRRAPKFYGVMVVAVVVGLAMNYFQFNAVRMLFWAAVINGILAPPLIVLVTLLSSDSQVMGDKTSPPLLRWLGWATALIMVLTTSAMVMVWIIG